MSGVRVVLGGVRSPLEWDAGDAALGEHRLPRLSHRAIGKRRRHLPLGRLVAIRELIPPASEVARDDVTRSEKYALEGGAARGSGVPTTAPKLATGGERQPSASPGAALGASAAPKLAVADARQPPDDATLALALQNEDPRAHVVAWTWLSPVVRRILRRTLGPGGDVEDLVQEVFLLLFRRIDSLREPATLRAFVMGITVRVARAEIRRRHVRRWIGLSSGPELLDQGAAAVDLDSREALVRFYAVLDRINTRDRTAFVLHHIEGLDLATVATALGTSTPTARRCVARAWKRVVLLAERDPRLVEYLQSKQEGGPARGTRRG